MNDEDFVEAAVGLPARFADRIPPEDLASIAEFANVGAWDEEVDLLIACLVHANATVTSVERDLLTRLLGAMNLPTDQLSHLTQ